MARSRREVDTGLTGRQLRTAFVGAARLLERHRDHINALNVFPVPDGDTGTNMLLTVQSVNDEASRAGDDGVGTVSSAMARGALLGARGNSGVILSQFLQGLAAGLQQKERATGRDLAEALEMAQRAAYKAVSKPVEGTMLTVIRRAAEAAHRAADKAGAGCISVWEAALDAAREAVARTPEQLPVLREAGVVDAGGEGLAVILEGGLHTLQGNGHLDAPLPPPVAARPKPVISEDFLKNIESEAYGYCTQLLLEGHELNADRIRAKVSSMGRSTVVVGNDSMVKIHVHAEDPGPVISYAVSLGALTQVKIENMDRQREGFTAFHRGGDGKTARLAVVAVSWGDGFDRVFSSAGALGVVSSRETMNPSAQELLTAVQSVDAEQVILLPNNPNVVPVAQQAAAISSRPIHVVESESLPQGVSALLAFNPEGDLESNLKAMRQARTKVRSAAVTTAIRPSRVGRVKIQAGDYICLADDKLFCTAASALESVQRVMRRLKPASGDVVTLYWGGDATDTQAQEAGEWVRSAYPGVEVEVVGGGQPLYHYIISVE